jgi:hypothetical protein
VAVGIGTGISVGTGVAVGIGAIVGAIAAGGTGVEVGNSATCTGAVGARRAVAMASTSVWGSLPLSGATPVTA